MSTRTTHRDEASISGRFAEIGKHIDDLVARIDAPNSDALKNVRGFIDRELKVGREWIDEIRVQNDLGKMEVRDRIVPALDRLEIAYEKGSRRIHRLLEDPVIDLYELGSAVTKELQGLQREIEEAGRNYRIVAERRE